MFASISDCFRYAPMPAPPPEINDEFKRTHHQELRPTLWPNDWRMMWVSNGTGESVTPVRLI